MTTVTLQADETLLKRATAVLAQSDMTLDEAFERTLMELARLETPDTSSMPGVTDAMARLKHLRFDPPYTRDEMHER